MTHLLTDRHKLLHAHIQDTNLFHHLKRAFCGKIIDYQSEKVDVRSDVIIYLCGDIVELSKYLGDNTFVISELSYNLPTNHQIKQIFVNQIPLNIHGLALYVGNFYDDNDYFHQITNRHTFGDLTESNKSGTSYRKGLYLSNVEKNTDKTINWNLLRCSTNFSGPTESLTEIDIKIIEKTNQLVYQYFDNPAKLNHVLAQRYDNHQTDNLGEKRAKIKKHSDKTKDMPENATIAFATFYSSDLEYLGRKSNTNELDRVYKNSSVLTNIRFDLKKSVKNSGLIPTWSLPLYPNSILIIPLSTNQLYTHQIVPPTLPVNKIPTRLGYVIRSSNCEAIYQRGEISIKSGSQLVKLKRPTQSEIDSLKNLYYLENTSDQQINYPEIFWSFNDGDYKPPITVPNIY